MRVSIVVPVLDEAGRIEGLLGGLRADFPDCELLVVDGGSGDATAALAARYARTITAPRGRANQLNAGAGATGGDVLWFVHADTRPEPAALPAIRAALADPWVVGGGCRIRFDVRTPALRYLAWISTWRARALREVYGDQAIFVRRHVFDELGGFPGLPLMEDLEFSHRLRRRGRLVIVRATVTASARRFTEHGVWPMIVLMQWLKLQYALGVDPERIRRRYTAGPPRLWQRRLWQRRRGPASNRSRPSERT